MTTPENHGETSPGDEDLGFDLPAPASLSARRAIVIGASGAAVVALAFVIGYLPRHRARVALEEGAHGAEAALPRVDVIAPKIGSSDRALNLPGSVQALQETLIYSRADGFVRRWLVDIGDVVKDGQLLAELDTPELDQQLDQSKAQLDQATASVAQAKANRDFSKTTYDRYVPLTQQGLTAPQDLDQRRAQAAVDEASVGVALANVAVQQANMRRLSQLKAFARVTAPFAGRITARSVELGSLVSAASGAPLFKLAATDPARVFIQVPQDVAPGVRAQLPANVGVREYPGRTFVGTVTRAAGELDAATRTMNTEVRVPNGDGALIPGMYAQVTLTLPYPHRVFEIPATALVNDAKGMRVAVVGPGETVHMTPIVVERDTGASLEVASGLTGTERIVKVPNASIEEGTAVAVAGPDVPAERASSK
jgi:membrane fusion protein (multidrug efflux system)